MAATTGTIIVAKSIGAHMGLSTKFVRTPDTTEVCFPIWFECTSTEASSTPESWHCQLRNEILGHLGFFSLTKVDPVVDSLCGVFEDGMNIGSGAGSSK
jgi:hypothetical protein